MLASLLAGVAQAATPAAWVPTTPTQCTLEGWTTDRDPAGLNVRAAPSAQAAIVGTLPAFEANTQLTRTSRFSIKGSANGWLRIDGGADYRVSDVPDDWPDRPAYAGAGWISGRHAGFAVQSARGYARPDASAAKLIDLKGDWLTDLGKIDRVVACSGDWALLDFHLEHRRDGDRLADLSAREQSASKARAWFRGTCAMLETTCDQPDPDGGSDASPQTAPTTNGGG